MPISEIELVLDAKAVIGESRCGAMIRGLCIGST